MTIPIIRGIFDNQLIMLFSGFTSSKSYDITLMVLLLRHLSNSTEPINGFDHLPPHTEISTVADFARLKHNRNKLVHSSSDEVENRDYKTSWKNITEVIMINVRVICVAFEEV